MIDKYPSCKRLTEAYRRVYHMPNKTPLSILFEYASRLNLQVCVSIASPIHISIAGRSTLIAVLPSAEIWDAAIIFMKGSCLGKQWEAMNAGQGRYIVLACLQLSFEEGQTSQGYFTLTLQLKNDREACLYRPGVGQVCPS